MADPTEGLGFLINDVARLLRRNFVRRAQAQSLSLSLAEWRALAYLSRQEGVNQTSLAESIEIQPMTLARLIDKLQALGLVERRRDPNDRRAFLLHLTMKAQPFLQQMTVLAREAREDALRGLPAEQRTALVAALGHVKQNLLDTEPRAINLNEKKHRAS